MQAQQHKETAVERLTTPTAMRMLKTLQQTQGGKQEWHIATGVPFKSKQLSPDEMSAMVERLCTPKHEADNLPPKLHVSRRSLPSHSVLDGASACICHSNQHTCAACMQHTAVPLLTLQPPAASS